MAYDEDLADRIRELVASEAGLTARKMFGESDSEGSTQTSNPPCPLAATAILPPITKRQLTKWIERGASYARSLPAKR